MQITIDAKNSNTNFGYFRIAPATDKYFCEKIKPNKFEKFKSIVRKEKDNPLVVVDVGWTEETGLKARLFIPDGKGYIEGDSKPIKQGFISRLFGMDLKFLSKLTKVSSKMRSEFRQKKQNNEYVQSVHDFIKQEADSPYTS